jgi:hypothetical protein
VLLDTDAVNGTDILLARARVRVRGRLPRQWQQKKRYFEPSTMVGAPVVMIGGFTHPRNQFTTPFRAINHHADNGSWNGVRHRFDHSDFLWRRRHKDAPRQFDCKRLNTVDEAKAAIRRFPQFVKQE